MRTKEAVMKIHPQVAPALHMEGTVLPQGVVRDVFVQQGRLTFEQPPDAQTIARDIVLVPGLVDTHAHLALASPVPAATVEEAITASASVQLDAGVLLLREPGSPYGSSLGVGPERGLPRTITGGRFIAAPGGYVPGFAVEVDNDELVGAAIEQARSGSAWVKFIGDKTYPGGDHSPPFTTESLSAAVEAVHGLGARVAVHASDPSAIDLAIAADVDSVEHAFGLREEHLPALSDRDIVLVPTLQALHALVGQSGPDAEGRWLRTMAAAQPDMIAAAVDAGVTVLAGTDAGLVAHGLIAREIAALARCGLDALTALGAGSWHAREFLGMPGIAEGAPADLVGFRDDPRDDLTQLARPALVVLDGRVIRTPSEISKITVRRAVRGAG